jgi:hypothetical protein
MSKRKRMFSCPECGEPYEANPPDDDHPRASLEDPRDKAAGTVIKTTHDCNNKNCRHPITLYWYRQKIAFHVA